MKILYIHGINITSSRGLKFSWDQALLGQESKETSLCYWGDILHPSQDIFSMLPEKVEKDILQTVLPDVFKYLFDLQAQEAIEKRLIDLINQMDEPFILVAHSLGSVIAWKVLTQLEKRVEIPLFLLIGTPLGIDRLQVELMKQTGIGELHKPPGVVRMTSFADPFDPVAADKTIADEFKGRFIKDYLIMNPDQFRTDTLGPHSSTGYLRHKQVRGEVANTVLAYSNPVTKFLYKLGS